MTTSLLTVAKNQEMARKGAASSHGGAVFLSLSIGTLKSPKLTNYAKNTILESMVKLYPDKVMFYKFKNPRRLNATGKKATDASQRTEEQATDSLEASLRRTRREISDIVQCNDFDKFATFTFDPKKHPQASDYSYAKKKMIQWLNKQQARHGAFNYLVVPERQKNGNLHFHALLDGFTGKYHATNMRGKGKTARQCYKIDSWEKSNGFADMEEIGNKEATAHYIGKYISKDISNNEKIQQKGEKRYFSSRSLKRPKKLYNKSLNSLVAHENLQLNTLSTWENDYVEITTIRKK